MHNTPMDFKLARFLADRRRWLRTLAGVTTLLLIGTAAMMMMGRAFRLSSIFLPIIMAAIGMLNAAWWLRADLRLVDLGQSRRTTAVRLVLAGYVAAMCVPLVTSALGLFEWRQMPFPVAMWVQTWHMSLAFIVPIGAIGGAIVWLIHQVRPASAKRQPPTDPPFNASRRTLLQQSLVAAPIVLAGATTASGIRQIGRFERHRRIVSPPGLPDRLRGLTITHLSDFHVGRLFREDGLRRAIDAANQFKSDIVVITGDVVDNSNQVLPETIAALGHLEHRHGLFLCLGNHDLIDDGQEYAECILKAGFPLLLNERRRLHIGGETLQIAGLLWSHRDSQSAMSGPGHKEHAAAALGDAPPDLFTIALAHHPHAFDALAGRGVAITLSGHTHGGQLMLTPPGLPPIGAGNLLFRYIRGFFTRPADGALGSARVLPSDGTVRSPYPMLFVNSGVGHWFPLRVNAPAEIVQLQLV